AGGHRAIPPRRSQPPRHRKVFYRASVVEDPSDGRLPWKPSMFMPRWASRITLEVTRVRVQRVQEIGEDDARAEGFPTYTATGNGQSGEPVGAAFIDGREWYVKLWDSLNAKRGYGWAANPWVWVIEFRRAA